MRHPVLAVLPRSVGVFTAVILCGSLAVILCESLVAQRERVPTSSTVSPDPYTRGDEAAMQRLGYRSFGPFAWGDGHDTAAMQKSLPTVPLRFVETAHFKIASSLQQCALPKSSKRKRALVRELEALGKLLPGVKPRARQLDPWLRLHLYAMRLEQHYAAFQALVGVTDADFPATPLPAGEIGPRGQGPYLGMRGKFLIMLCHKASTLGRYAHAAAGQQQASGQPFAHYFLDTGSIFYGTHTEIVDGRLADEHKMHCHVIFCASQALIMGYQGFHYHLPAWLVQGLGHWFSHRLDPLEHTYRTDKERYAPDVDPHWHRNVLGLVKNAAGQPLRDLCRIQHSHQLEVIDVMTAWSRVDFMLARHPETFKAFFAATKAPIRGTPAGPPPFATVLRQQDAAFLAAWKQAPDAFDVEWGEFVRKTYRKR